MPNNMPDPPLRRDWEGAAVALACIALAAYVLRASAAYTRFGAVFPRTVALLMLGIGAALVLFALLRRGPGGPRPRDNIWRTAGLVGVGALWLALIQAFGFYWASLVGFGLAGLLARYEAWTLRDIVVHVIVTVSTVSAFYALFLHGLGVRLP